MVSSGDHESKNWVRDLYPRASGQVRKDNQSWNQERRSHCGTALLRPTLAIVTGGFLLAERDAEIESGNVQPIDHAEFLRRTGGASE